MSDTQLTRRELEALEDIAKWQCTEPLTRMHPYFFRQASMQKLHARGYVEPMPGYERYAAPGWRITAAGREHLKGFPEK